MIKKALALSVLAALSSQASAFRFDTGDDWSIRWDNTLKGNVMARVAKQDRDVYAAAGSTGPLADDPDLSVDRGDLVSTRFDILTEMDAVWKETIGFRVSAAGWYDPMYNDSSNRQGDRTLQNGFSPASATWGLLSEDPGDYSSDAQDLHYLGGEVLDAFLFANWNIGDVAGNLRLGRHTLYWGSSVFPTGSFHGIAGGMVAIDLAKGFGSPGSEAKELYLPNSKVSTVIQFTENWTFNAFYAFEHVVNRFPESGTYFSPAEVLTENSEFATLIPGALRTGFRVRDDKYKDSGEWGVNFQYFIDRWGLETSFVYINATGRAVSGLYGAFGGVPAEETAKFIAKSNANVAGYYGWVYKNDIDTYGISLSKEIAGISVGMDLVYRENMALNPNLTTSLTARPGTTPANWSGDDADEYPGGIGDSWHVVLNGVGFLSPDWGLWDGGTYVVEVVASALDDYVENELYVNTRIHKGRVVTNIAALVKPTWYQVWSGWDLSVPISVNYGIDGEQAVLSQGGNEELGNASIGIEFNINEKWNWATKYNMFFGPAANGTGGLLKDRDNISTTLKRTF